MNRRRCHNKLVILKRRRQWWLQVHLWLGLVLGLFLSVFGLTGSVLVFQSELDRFLNPELYTVSVPLHAVRKSMQEIAEALEQAAPAGWQSAGTAIPESPDGAYVFGLWYETPTAPPENAVSLNISIDPYSGEVVGRRVFYHAWNPLRHCLVGFFFKLHYALCLGDFGNALVAIMAALLVISLLTGLILWWPLDGKWRRVLTIKRHASAERFYYDVHQVSGVFSILILVVVLISGVSFNFPEQFKSLVSVVSPVSADPTPAVAVGVRLDIDVILQELRTLYPGGRMAYLDLPTPRNALLTACFQHVPALHMRVVDNRCITADSHDGRIVRVADTDHGSTGDIFMEWQWPLHSGQAFGWIGRGLVFLSGLICPVLFVTGFIRWQQKVRARRMVAVRKPKIKPA